ncbi:MAG TPA: protein kinase [Bryobacteraceae bacterium]
MPLSIGDKLGPYEILAPIGKGGMGDVYRARDTRLGRDVAIKVSAERFSERFEREARAIASLNHPNICTLHDIGPNYLVMELVEGATLSERIVKGALPLDESLKIAVQIAEAIDTAHENGIVHRDLKPANIKIKPDGMVKVLDFGLAKVSGASAGKPEDSLTLTMGLTETGLILGTAPYMAPEQARGEAVDKRADIWAFGVVLFEMLTGRRLFAGKTISDTLASVLTKEPEWDSVPPRAERLLRRCLERDPKRRLRDIGEARFLLEDDGHIAAPASESRWLWKISTAILAIVLMIALVFFSISRHQTAAPMMQLSVDLGNDAALAPGRGTSMALSPDGSQLVFVTGQALVKSRLAIRRLDQTKAVPLAGTDGAESPFFSADGKSIGFFADGKLKKMDATGSVPVTLCDAPSQREGSWGEDNNIVFAATNHGGLSRVSSSGGTPQPVTELDKQRGEWTHRFPQVLPGAEAVLFATGSNLSAGEANIDVLSFKTGKRKTLVEAGAYGHYLPSGHLIYMHRGTLFAAPMDLGRLDLTGAPVPVLEDVSFRRGTGAAGFTFSASGMFVYVPANPEEKLRPISVVDQNGKIEVLPVPPGGYDGPRLSPDGTRLAVTVDDASGTNIYIYDWAAQRLSRLTVLNGNSESPVWTPDGKHLVFSSDAQSPGPGIYWTRADGGTPQRLLEGASQSPHSFSPDATRLTFDREGAAAGIWMLPLDWSDAAGPKAGVPERLVTNAESGAQADSGTFSRDGRWLAYVAAPFGLPEIFVRPSSGRGQWQISAGGNGGQNPVWSRDGQTLFYQGVVDSRIMAMDYSLAGDSFSPGHPRLWSDALPSLQAFDLMPDGKRIVGIPSVLQKEPTHAIFLLNFSDELRRKVPAGK